MKKIIKWGFIGLGNASLNLANEFKNVENASLAAISSKTDKKRQFFKDSFKISSKYVYSEYDEIINNPDIDIIYIALPNSMHKEYCIKALSQKKNILVEKPITTSLKNFQDIKNSIKDNNLILEEGIAYKFHPFYKTILNLIKDISKSKIISIKCSFGNDAIGGRKIFGLRLKKINQEKRLFNKHLEGGAILDGGIYPISIITDIIYLIYNNLDLEPKIINCKKDKISNGIDINSELILNLDNINVEIKTSLNKKLQNNLEITTNNEKIVFENIFNINKDTFIVYKKNSIEKKIKCSDNKSSYFYEIKSLSDMSNNIYEWKKISDQSILKMNFNIKLLSRWLEN